MKKLVIMLLISMSLISGCSIVKVSDKSTSDLLASIIYVDNKLANVFMDGYEFYLPQGLIILDKKDYNLKIKDNNSIYYLYIDTIAYHYKEKSTFKENSNHFFSQKFNNAGVEGYVDIVENGDYYFVVLMYNYAKIESYVLKDDFNTSFISMCSILGSVKYNDSVINGNIGNKSVLFQEEKFDIFNSSVKNDNFLVYEEEYGTYKEKIDINKDNDIIIIEETVE